MEKSEEPIHIKADEEKKELLFSGGAGAVSQMFGWVQGLLEIVPKEILREYSLGGVSAGVAVAGQLHICLHSEYTMKHWYDMAARKFFLKDNRKYFGLFTHHKLIKELGIEFYRKIEELNIPELKGKLHLYVSLLEGLSIKELLVDHFEDEYDFADALLGSMMIPMFTKFALYSEYRGQKVIDGGASKPIPYKHEHSRKVFINVLPKAFRQWPFVRKQPKNMKYLDIAEKYDFKMPRDYWIWDEEWSDEMFLKGQLSAKYSKIEIMELFGMPKEEIQQKLIESPITEAEMQLA